jgi:synaptojanin
LFSEDYDTSEKCRAPAWTDRVLWRRRIQQLDADNPNFNPGKLLFYGRAELKQSDHRPVVAILDVEYSLIDPDKRARVFNEVIVDLGPPDATVVIQATEQPSDDDEDSIYDENVTAALVQELAEIGEVTLVRFVGETMWVTFKDGQAAVAAVKHKGYLQVCGINLTIKLKTDDWVKHVEKEILLCTTNCVQLCDYIDVSPNSDYNSLGIPVAPEKKKPPARPALPKSPQVTPKHHPRHQVSDFLKIVRAVIDKKIL